MDKQLEILSDMFAAMQGDDDAKNRLSESKKKIELKWNTVIITDEDGKKSEFTVM